MFSSSITTAIITSLEQLLKKVEPFFVRLSLSEKKWDTMWQSPFVAANSLVWLLGVEAFRDVKNETLFLQLPPTCDHSSDTNKESDRKKRQKWRWTVFYKNFKVWVKWAFAPKSHVPLEDNLFIWVARPPDGSGQTSAYLSLSPWRSLRPDVCVGVIT